MYCYYSFTATTNASYLQTFIYTYNGPFTQSNEMKYVNEISAKAPGIEQLVKDVCDSSIATRPLPEVKLTTKTQGVQTSKVKYLPFQQRVGVT